MTKLLTSALVAAISLLPASATTYSTGPALSYPSRSDVTLLDRSLPDAPNGYTPTTQNCPANRPTIRNAATLSQNETDWLNVRRPQALQAMRTLFQQLNITGLDTNSYFDTHLSNSSLLPNVGIAVSGGGYRAMLNGAGALSAFDSRTRHNSTQAGALSGLLQSATYLAGLSGGSWLVGSLYVNNFTSIQQILDQNLNVSGSGSLWQFGNSIFEGPDTGSIQLLSTAGYYSTIASQVKGKGDAGYNLTITDYWGRALSFQLVNASAGGPSYTFSSIAEQDFFTSGGSPLPLIVADGRNPGEAIISSNSTVYEFNPWELGSWDPTVYGFAPTRYLGSNFSNGAISDSQQCVRGYDNAGYVMGTSSSLFNQFLLGLNSSTYSGVLYDALRDVLGDLSSADDDIADYVNPFLNYHNETNPTANEQMLTLVDGGSDLQNIPLYPLIQPERHVDVIFAIDSSADTNSTAPAPNWPNGTSLVATYERQFVSIGNGTVFPSVPDQQTFVNLGLNARPSFFGCDASNLTGPSPLIVYLPNAPYAYNSNVSTFDPAYTDAERNAIIENGYDVVTQANGTFDTEWPTCVGCAILNRSLNRTNTTMPEVCVSCFERYCWNGTRDSTYTDYIPHLKLAEIKTSGAAEWSARSGFAAFMALSVGLVLVF